jgi:type I restriction enzyme S subunit
MTKEEYKEKLTWLESIPKTWAVKPLLSVSKEISVKSSTGELLSVYLDRGVIRASDGNLGTHAPSETMDNYQSIEPGDFVLNNQQAWRGSVGVSFEYGIISPAYLVLRLSEELDSRYSNYLFRSRPIVDQFMLASQGVGTIQRQIHAPSFKNVLTIVPPLETQKRIATFLDERTKSIDELVAKKENLIKLLNERRQSLVAKIVTKGLDSKAQMKYSGMDWLGSIPATWEVRRFKYIFNRIQRPIFEEDEIITAFRDGVVTLRRNRREEGFTFAFKEVGYQGVNKGDLVIHGMDGFAGAIGVSDSRGKATPVYSVCMPISDRASSKYFAYLLRVLALNGYIASLSRGIRERSTEFKWDVIGNLRVVLPEYEIQEKIASYLDVELDKIMKASELIMSQIQQLRECRVSLIYSAVTGKIKI